MILAAASWPDALIAFAVPLNTIVLFLLARRQTHAKAAAEKASEKTSDAIEQLGELKQQSETQVQALEKLANSDDFPSHLR